MLPRTETVGPSAGSVHQLGHEAASLKIGLYEWCEIVKDHKRNGRYDEALVILDGCMRVEEAHRGGVAPWYYEQAAIIHRKRRDRNAELALLRQFAAQQHAPGATSPKLLERLAKLEAADTSQ